MTLQNEIDKQVEEYQKLAVIIANIVYDYNGSDVGVIEKQVGRTFAGETLSTLIQDREKKAYRRGKLETFYIMNPESYEQFKTLKEEK